MYYTFQSINCQSNYMLFKHRIASYFPCFLPLPKVIDWATKHKDDAAPPEDDENKEKRTDDIDPWDMEFLKVDQGTLFELILVSETDYIDSNVLKHFLLFPGGLLGSQLLGHQGTP